MRYSVQYIPRHKQYLNGWITVITAECYIDIVIVSKPKDTQNYG